MSLGEKPDTFPDAFVWVIADFLDTSMPDLEALYRRPLRPTDANPSAGVFANDWTPGDRVIGQRAPLINDYRVTIHLLHKNTSEEEGIAKHSVLTKELRRMMERNDALPVRLAASTESVSGIRERFHRLQMTKQRFLANEVKGQFLFFSVSDLTIQTETF